MRAVNTTAKKEGFISNIWAGWLAAPSHCLGAMPDRFVQHVSE